MTILKSVANPFGRILLITGDSEYLRERTRTRALASVRDAEPEVQVTESSVVGVSSAELIGFTSPSLFSERTALVLRDVESAAEDAAAALLEYADDPVSDIAMILVHGGGRKGSGFLNKIRKASVVREIAIKAPKYDNQLASWVKDECREQGRIIEDRAAAGLVAAVGSDLRSLAGAIDQLVASSNSGEALTAELVGKYFGGRAQVKGFEIADLALAGQITGAIEAWRWAEEARVPPVLVTSAFATGMRQLAQVATATPGADLAGEFGIPPFKVKALRQLARSWSDKGLRAGLEAVAKADTDVKGGSAEPGWSVERLVIEIARARDLR